MVMYMEVLVILRILELGGKLTTDTQGEDGEAGIIVVFGDRGFGGKFCDGN